MKAPRLYQVGDVRQVSAYAFQTGGNAVDAGIMQGHLMGAAIQFYAGDGASGIVGAQQHTQGAAPCTQIQHRGILWQLNKSGQCDGVCA